MNRNVIKHSSAGKNSSLTENLNYLETGKESIWGHGDRETLDILNNEPIKGNWLSLASGDGRYCLDLLQKVDSLTVSDIDKSALEKLVLYTPTKYRNMLNTKTFDITKPFPFEDSTFDGIFCTGTLHLFSLNILKGIILEIKRVLKPTGTIFIDFATDIERISARGEDIVYGDEPRFKLKEAKEVLTNLLQGFDLKISEAHLEEADQKAEIPYTLKCNFLIIVGQKN